MIEPPLKIFGTEFKPCIPSEAIQNRVKLYFANCDGSYHQTYQCFECPFYQDTVIVKLSSKGTKPRGLISLWLSNDSEFLNFSLEIAQLRKYNKIFNLNINANNIKYYASFISKNIKTDDMYLQAPKDIKQIQSSESFIQNLITVNPASDGWTVLSYHISSIDNRIAEVNYFILYDGSIQSSNVHAKLLDQKAIYDGWSIL